MLNGLLLLAIFFVKNEPNPSQDFWRPHIFAIFFLVEINLTFFATLNFPKKDSFMGNFQF